MKRSTEKTIINIMREEYKRRIVEVVKGSLGEADFVDKRGNMLLSKGLKVRHKKSGYEYTVAKVEPDAVYLRHPDQPRFNPPNVETTLSESEGFDVAGIDLEKVQGNPVPSDPPEAVKATHDPDPGPSILKVSRADFEKEYEVK